MYPVTENPKSWLNILLQFGASLGLHLHKGGSPDSLTMDQPLLKQAPGLSTQQQNRLAHFGLFSFGDIIFCPSRTHSPQWLNLEKINCNFLVLPQISDLVSQALFLREGQCWIHPTDDTTVVEIISLGTSQAMVRLWYRSSSSVTYVTLRSLSQGGGTSSFINVSELLSATHRVTLSNTICRKLHYHYRSLVPSIPCASITPSWFDELRKQVATDEPSTLFTDGSWSSTQHPLNLLFDIAVNGPTSSCGASIVRLSDSAQ